MSLKEDVLDMKEDLEMLKQESFAMEILRDYKKANQRQFIIILLLLIILAVTGGYLVYTLEDIEKVTDSIDIQGVETIDNSHIKIGDDVWEKSQ